MPQVVDAVDVPVIAAGGIAEGRGVAAVFMLGASGVQIGTAYLLCPEFNVSVLHAAASAQPVGRGGHRGRSTRSLVVRGASIVTLVDARRRSA